MSGPFDHGDPVERVHRKFLAHPAITRRLVFGDREQIQVLETWAREASEAEAIKQAEADGGERTWRVTYLRSEEHTLEVEAKTQAEAIEAAEDDVEAFGYELLEVLAVELA